MSYIELQIRNGMVVVDYELEKKKDYIKFYPLESAKIKYCFKNIYYLSFQTTHTEHYFYVQSMEKDEECHPEFKMFLEQFVEHLMQMRHEPFVFRLWEIPESDFLRMVLENEVKIDAENVEKDCDLS